MPTYKELMRVRDAGQKKIDAICREIQRLQAEHDELTGKRGEMYYVLRQQVRGEMRGLRKALCLFFDWDFAEADTEGLATQYAREWSDVPRETSKQGEGEGREDHPV